MVMHPKTSHKDQDAIDIMIENGQISPEEGQYLRDRVQNPINTGATISAVPANEGFQGPAAAIINGALLGGGDEVVAAAKALLGKYMGSDQSFGDMYSEYRDDEERARQEYAEDSPVSSMAHSLSLIHI